MFAVEIRIFISVLHLLKRCIHRALFCCELLWRQIQLNFMCKDHLRYSCLFLLFRFAFCRNLDVVMNCFWLADWPWLHRIFSTFDSDLMLETQLYRKNYGNCGINKIEKKMQAFPTVTSKSRFIVHHIFLSYTINCDTAAGINFW